MDVGSLLFGSQLANISVRKGRARKSDFEPPCDLRERMSRERVKQHTSPNESRSKTEISNLCNLLLFVFPLKESQLKLCMQHLKNQNISRDQLLPERSVHSQASVSIYSDQI